jgi:hypothetical protein
VIIAKIYLHESEVTINACKGIYVEHIAMFEYARTIPFLGHTCSKSQKQMYSAKYTIHPDNAHAPPSIPCHRQGAAYRLLGLRLWDSDVETRAALAVVR